MNEEDMKVLHEGGYEAVWKIWPKYDFIRPMSTEMADTELPCGAADWATSALFWAAERVTGL